LKTGGTFKYLDTTFFTVWCSSAVTSWSCLVAYAMTCETRWSQRKIRSIFPFPKDFCALSGHPFLFCLFTG
jgi:hypothetical protein